MQTSSPPAQPPPPSSCVPGLSDAFLSSDYSMLLYDEPEALDLRHARILWPTLLDEQSVTSLSGKVNCVHSAAPVSVQMSPPPFAFVHPPANVLQGHALWVHRPRTALLPAVPNDTWVEVTHCPYAAGHVKMWLFAAPGSGLWMNVGRTLILSVGRRNVGRRIHEALRFGRTDEFLSIINHTHPGHEYDTVQFEEYHAASWPPGESFTEIVVTNGGWSRENASVADPGVLEHFRCGVAPGRLRACRASDVAVRMQSRCRQKPQADPTIARLCCAVLRGTKCSVSSTNTTGENATSHSRRPEPHASRATRMSPMARNNLELEGFRLLLETGSCCRRPGDAQLAKFSPAKFVTPLSCARLCSNTSRCTHFSHSRKWQDCFLCAACMPDRTLSSQLYTSFVRSLLGSTRRISKAKPASHTASYNIPSLAATWHT